MLSNTAVPVVYGKFRDAVIRGEIAVNEKIALQMNRIDRRIQDPRYYYDYSALQGWKDFQETEMVLTDGDPQKLLDSFLLWAEDLYCWFYFEEKQVYEPLPNRHGGRFVKKTLKRRLTKKQYIITARGSAKTVYLTDIHAYSLIVDEDTTNQITTAPTMRQATEVTNLFKTAITMAIGPVFQFLTEGSLSNTTGSKANRPKLFSSKKGIEYTLTNSILSIVPMSIEKLQGLRPKCATVDEWLSCELREDPVGAIEQGATKIPGWMIICTSSEGTIRNGVGDDIKMELDSILKGDYVADHVSIWWYRLDKIEEVNDPELWIKANPNLGITVEFSAYHEDVERAEKVPSARNDILAKRFGIPMEGFTYFFPYNETLPHKHREYYGMACAMGADLSQGDDFCAFTFLFPLRDGSFGVKTRAYITFRTLSKLPASMREKYENEFIAEGSLVIMEGITLKMEEVYEDLDDYILKCEYDVRCFGYDPYNAEVFVTNFIRDNGELGVQKVIQGSRTESVPLGELKKLSEERMLIFDEKLMQFAMGNCIVLEDTNGNRKLYKKRSDQKIDNVAAMMDAYVAYKDNTDLFD